MSLSSSQHDIGNEGRHDLPADGLSGQHHSNQYQLDSDHSQRVPGSDDGPLRPWYGHWIVQIAGLIGSLSLIGAFIQRLFPGVNFSDPKTIMLVLVILNFLVLMIFCLGAIKVPHLEFRLTNRDAAIQKYTDLMNVETSKGVSNNHRVNMLVKQLNDNIIYYALTLMVVYLVYILERMGKIPPDNPYARAVSDIFNYLSSVFLYLSFKVLYNKTLDDNNSKMIYYIDALFFSFFYILIYVGFFNSTEVYIHNDMSLLSGIFNGMAMALLFGRFVSMEHFLMALFDDRQYRNIIPNQKMYYFGTVFLLPLYVLAQPLFGDFKLKEFGDSDVFANLVFFTCFVGKLFFLLAYYMYSRKKLLHLYLHLVITKYGVPRDFINCFEIK